jgi:hypothetical protein
MSDSNGLSESRDREIGDDHEGRSAQGHGDGHGHGHGDDHGHGHHHHHDVCFTADTLIGTAAGEIAVQDLKIGDLIRTYDGRFVPIRWIGHQVVASRFREVQRLPVRVKATAFGEDVPCRDLIVSPDHALFVDDVLLQAAALVNGTSIVHEVNSPAFFTYYHVEVDDHSLIFAENTPAETFVDNVDRANFDNWDEYQLLYPRDKAVAELPYPRALATRQVPRIIRNRLAHRGNALYGAILAPVA